LPHRAPHRKWGYRTHRERAILCLHQNPRPRVEEADADKASPPTADESQPRDEKGRFAAKEDAEAQPETAPEAEAEAEAEPTAGEGEVEAQPDAEPEPEPWTFRADGTDFEIPGSRYSEADGLHIPPDQIESVTQLLRFGKTHQGSFRQHLADKDAEVAAAGVERDAAQAAKTAILEKLAGFADNPDAMAQFLDEFHKELPILLAQAEAAEERHRREADQKKLAELEAEREWRDKTPVLEDRLEEAIQHYGKANSLDLEAMRSIWAKLRSKDQFERIFTREGAGQWQENLDIVEREAQYLATALGGRTIQPTQRKEAKLNEAALKEGKKAPPTAPSKKGPPPKATPKPPKFEGTQQVDEWFEEGGYNEFFE
jgi:hypothetical protein